MYGRSSRSGRVVQDLAFLMEKPRRRVLDVDVEAALALWFAEAELLALLDDAERCRVSRRMSSRLTFSWLYGVSATSMISVNLEAMVLVM